MSLPLTKIVALLQVVEFLNRVSLEGPLLTPGWAPPTPLSSLKDKAKQAGEGFISKFAKQAHEIYAGETANGT